MGVGILPAHRLNEIVHLAEKAYLNSGEGGTFNPEYWLYSWNYRYRTQTGGIIVVEEDDGTISAVMALTTYNDPNTGDLILSECGWYSEGNNGGKLLNMAINMAEELGAKQMYTQCINDEYKHLLDRIFTRRGFALKYHRYLKEF